MMFLALYVLYALTLSLAMSRRRISERTQRTPPVPGGSPRRILVVGATGGTGRHVVAQALERGYDVTAFVRNPARFSMEHPRLSVVRGDVLDAASVDAAVDGHDAVVSALGHKRYYAGPRILSRGTANLVGAMSAHGVRRFVCETSLGIGESAGRMGLYYTLFVIPVILPLYFWDKTRQERVVSSSDLDWVIVRPGALTNGKKRGSFRHGPAIGSFLWTVRISRADVASFMLDQVEDDAYLRLGPGVSW